MDLANAFDRVTFCLMNCANGASVKNDWLLSLRTEDKSRSTTGKYDVSRISFQYGAPLNGTAVFRNFDRY